MKHDSWTKKHICESAVIAGFRQTLEKVEKIGKFEYFKLPECVELEMIWHICLPKTKYYEI